MRFTVLLSALSGTALLVGCSSEEPAPPYATVAEEQSEAATPPTPEPKPEVAPQDDTPGLAVGELAPKFELSDQHGQQQSLSKLLSEGPVALVFYRSADW